LGYNLVVRDAPKSPAAEAIRAIRTNLQFAAMDKSLRTIMVTSAAPAEGKTLLSANLAASIAMSGVKTIIVGADLRKPTTHEVFGVSSQPGVTNVLLGTATLDEALHESGVPGLQVLPSGPIPPNPAEVIGSDAMANLVESLCERAEKVVFDATPVLAVTDAALLSRLVDGVLLVVAMKQTPREIVRQSCDILHQAKANILGVVANKDDVRGRSAYYHEYYALPEGSEANSSRAFRSKHSPFGVLSRIFNKASS